MKNIYAAAFIFVFLIASFGLSVQAQVSPETPQYAYYTLFGSTTLFRMNLPSGNIESVAPTSPTFTPLFLTSNPQRKEVYYGQFVSPSGSQIERFDGLQLTSKGLIIPPAGTSPALITTTSPSGQYFTYETLDISQNSNIIVQTDLDNPTFPITFTYATIDSVRRLAYLGDSSMIGYLQQSNQILYLSSTLGTGSYSDPNGPMSELAGSQNGFFFFVDTNGGAAQSSLAFLRVKSPASIQHFPIAANSSLWIKSNDDYTRVAAGRTNGSNTTVYFSNESGITCTLTIPGIQTRAEFDRDAFYLFSLSGVVNKVDVPSCQVVHTHTFPAGPFYSAPEKFLSDNGKYAVFKQGSNILVLNLVTWAVTTSPFANGVNLMATGIQRSLPV